MFFDVLGSRVNNLLHAKNLCPGSFSGVAGSAVDLIEPQIDAPGKVVSTPVNDQNAGQPD
jgi:hypothetical protein